MSLKIFNRNIKVFENKNVPQYINFRGEVTYINSSLKNIGTTYELQKELLKKEMDQMNLLKVLGWIKKMSG